MEQLFKPLNLTTNILVPELKDASVPHSWTKHILPCYHLFSYETTSQIFISIYFTLVLVSQEWLIAQALIFPEGIFRFATQGMCSNILSIRKNCAQSLSYPCNLALNLVFEAINEALPQQFMNLIKMYCYLTKMKQENLAWSFTEFNMVP